MGGGGRRTVVIEDGERWGCFWDGWREEGVIHMGNKGKVKGNLMVGVGKERCSVGIGEREGGTLAGIGEGDGESFRGYGRWKWEAERG